MSRRAERLAWGLSGGGGGEKRAVSIGMCAPYPVATNVRDAAGSFPRRRTNGFTYPESAGAQRAGIRPSRSRPPPFLPPWFRRHRVASTCVWRDWLADDAGRRSV